MASQFTHRFGAVVAIAALVVVAVAATPPRTASNAGAASRDITFSDTRLKNGLRVIIAEDHNAPVYSIAVSYNVGSRDERRGRTGFAHLFEHMMFKGSENVGPGEHFMLVFNNGGNMNGTTNKDRTDVLRDAADEPARPRALPRGRPHALARDQPRRISTTSATPCRKSAGSASTTSRTARRSRRSTRSRTTTSRTSTR